MQTVEITGRLFNQPVTVPVPTFGPCPLCADGHIYESSAKALGCTNWKGREKGCQFTIWREYYGVRLTDQDIADLLTRNETRAIDGFKSKDEVKVFSARLTLAGGKVKFKFR